jgi:hypothetical protein
VLVTALDVLVERPAHRRGIAEPGVGPQLHVVVVVDRAARELNEQRAERLAVVVGLPPLAAGADLAALHEGDALDVRAHHLPPGQRSQLLRPSLHRTTSTYQR